MNSLIKGKAFVLGDNIDTDQIIPAKYLSYDPSNEEEKKYFGKFALFGVPEGESGYPVINLIIISLLLVKTLVVAHHVNTLLLHSQKLARKS